MIYFDNSATTFPKPSIVINEVSNSLRNYSANPGRSGHSLSMLTARKVYDCRVALCRLFNVDDESKVIFTSGCTHALNIVIKGILKRGDHCIISCLEHNSVLRPLEKLRSQGVSYSIADIDLYDENKTVDNFRNCIKENTKLIVCTHASNVFGFVQPVEKICKLAHDKGVLFCLDAAQSAGVMPIDVTKYNYDFVCCAGHKGLYGPMGVGILVINTNVIPETLIEGGTGSDSMNFQQPEFIPDRFESGTLNIPGICGLKQGVEFVQAKGIENIYNYEMKHIRNIYNAFSENKEIVLYNNFNDKLSAPVLSFSVKGKDSEKISMYLSDKYNIATRAGLHCSPLAHRFMGTTEFGTVRVSPSVFTTENDIRKLIYAVKFF